MKKDTMNYWICITSKSNWDVILKEQIWGVAKKNQKNIEKMKVGDKCLIYVRQQIVEKKVIEPAIMGEYLVDSEVFENNSKIFVISDKLDQNETFPLRIRIKAVKIFKPSIDFKSLIPKLAFITNKNNWAAHLQGFPARIIPEQDFQFITSMKK